MIANHRRGSVRSDWHRFVGKGNLWWGHTFDVVLVFLFSLMRARLRNRRVRVISVHVQINTRRCLFQIRALSVAVAASGTSNITVSPLTLGEQFLTPSLESFAIHTVGLFHYFLSFLLCFLRALQRDAFFPETLESAWRFANNASREHSSAAGPHHAINFLLLLGLLLFGDKLLRNSGQLFKSKSTSLVVLQHYLPAATSITAGCCCCCCCCWDACCCCACCCCCWLVFRRLVL